MSESPVEAGAVGKPCVPRQRTGHPHTCSEHHRWPPCHSQPLEYTENWGTFSEDRNSATPSVVNMLAAGLFRTGKLKVYLWRSAGEWLSNKDKLRQCVIVPANL